MNYKYLILPIVFVAAAGCLWVVKGQGDSFLDWDRVSVRHIVREDVGFNELVELNESVELVEEDLGDLIIQEENNLQQVEIKDVLLDVPFTPQAPFGEWDNPVFQDGCEEATALMAMKWAKDESLTYKGAKEEIAAMAEYQLEKYGEARDTSVEDTVMRIFNGYFGYNKVEVIENIQVQDIIDELVKGNLVIVPTDGQALGNPYYKPPGPERHNLVVRGYDVESKEFITNDPGTRRGEGYRYKEDVLLEAIRDYPSGYHIPINVVDKVMIVVVK